MQEQILETPVLGIRHKFTVLTQGNFSYIVGLYEISASYVFSVLFLAILSVFEEKFGLKILNWDIRKVTSESKVRGKAGTFIKGKIEILVNHEPKESKKVPSESEDIGPLGQFAAFSGEKHDL